jgi:hypothetical protein
MFTIVAWLVQVAIIGIGFWWLSAEIDDLWSLVG